MFHLGNQSRVAHSWRQTDPESLEVAVDDVGFSDEGEGAQITQADPGQYDVAQLSAGGFHHWGVTESKHKHNQVNSVKMN